VDGIFSVIASIAKQSHVFWQNDLRDCRVAFAPRNDKREFVSTGSVKAMFVRGESASGTALTAMDREDR
jgi:hypothetical protein